MKRSIIAEDTFINCEFSGKYIFQETTDTLEEIKRNCTEHDVLNIFIEASSINDFLSNDDIITNESERLLLADKISSIFDKEYKIAFVANKTSYNGFVEYILTARGMNIKVFFNRKDAINWLNN